MSSTVNQSRRITAYVFVFFSIVSLLLCSGRLGSWDASGQLQAAYIFASTGQIGTEVPPGGFNEPLKIGNKSVTNPRLHFWQAPNGLYYQTHDIGNAASMVPFAWIGLNILSTNAIDQINDPPTLVKVIVSLVFSLQAAIVCSVLYLCLRLTLDSRRAFVYACLFLPTGFFLTYVRMPWDVTGAAVFSVLALYQVLLILHGNTHLTLRLIGAGVFTGFASNFRYSYGPFLFFMLAITLWQERHRFKKADILLGVISFCIAVSPSLLYNYLRMGSPFHPATVIPKYPTSPTLSINILFNFVRQMFSLNKGLFVFYPLVLICFLSPWKRTDYLRIGVMIGCILYALGLCATPSWSSGPTCWGPRYFVPVLPLLFYTAVRQMETVGGNVRKWGVAALVLGFLINVPSFVTNISLAITESPMPTMDDFSNFPYPQVAGWSGMLTGLSGHELPILDQTRLSIESGSASASRTFPDVFLAHLARSGQSGLMAAALIFVIAVFVAFVCLFKILGSENTRPVSSEFCGSGRAKSR